MFSGIKAVIYLEVTSPVFEAFDVQSFQKKYPELKKHKFRVINLHDEQRKEILKYGLSSIINPDYEHFTGRPHTRREDFVQALQKFLDKVLQGKSLVIIDPYIFPKKYDSDYCNFLVDILKKYLGKLNTITFITSANHNHDVKSKIINGLKKHNSKLNISVKLSEEFHDRFWISPRNRRGIFMGTSLNGLGKKYTVIDYIDNEDVREIMNGTKKIKIC